MRTTSITMWIERDEKAIEVECFFYYTPAFRGARDSLGGMPGSGPALEPDEPESFEYSHCKPEFDLTDEEIDLATEIVTEEYEEPNDNYKDSE